MKLISSESIILSDGTAVKGAAPMIISASRATDIPAFFAEWMVKSFTRGYVARINPFNGAKYYISLANCRFIVFWTKNFIPMMHYLDFFTSRNIRFYFQYTINDYEKENFEPGIPPLGKRINNFIELSGKYGKNSTVWRFDPLLLTDTVTPNTLLDRIADIYSKIGDYTDTLIISFADIRKYAGVRKNMKIKRIRYREWTEDEILCFSEKLAGLFPGNNIKIHACAENNDLKKYGITPSSCIDPNRIITITDDSDLKTILMSGKNIRDTGQRKLCRCTQSRDIGSYDTCANFCVYCYANGVENEVSEKRKKYCADSDGLCL